ncbi:hypothetical protein ABW636_17380 [Aquimarina sp. 2201CG1-2-11]|uniref:hypothetical protein n=1 Tax=Aquimarina discodermiae TaxID=3231043 RepID=UPI003461C548
MKYLYFILLIIVNACAPSTKEAKTNDTYTIEKVTNLRDNVSIKDLMLLTKEEAINKCGTPYYIERFILDDLQGEFRTGITFKYSLKERISESILIDEVTWEKGQETLVTVWYEVQETKAIPKEVCIWEKGDEF